MVLVHTAHGMHRVQSLRLKYFAYCRRRRRRRHLRQYLHRQEVVAIPFVLTVICLVLLSRCNRHKLHQISFVVSSLVHSDSIRFFVLYYYVFCSEFFLASVSGCSFLLISNCTITKCFTSFVSLSPLRVCRRQKRGSILIWVWRMQPTFYCWRSGMHREEARTRRKKQ